MALIHHQFIPSRIFFVRPFNSPHKFSKPSLVFPSKTPDLLSLCVAALPADISQSSGPIFLPVLEEEEERQRDEEEKEDREAVGEQAEDPDDPIYRFFKSRTSTSDHDPQNEGKLTLQKNRRVSWHLASDAESDEETEVDLDSEHSSVEEPEEEVRERKELSEGIVGEIVQIARNLPENLTLGEALNGYEGRVDKTECLDVLGFLGEEGRLFDCLYFFEWMKLQEPSLVTPRACSVLFPVLGRAGMGDKLMVLFRNLPSSKEFRDVRVYNAAISGFLYSARYEILGAFTCSARLSN